MDVELPDGTVIEGVPDGMSKADLTAKLARNGYDVSRLGAAPRTAAAQPAKTGYLQSVKNNMVSSGQAFNEILAEGAREAGRLGTTLIRPFESAQANAERRKGVNDFMADELPSNTFPALVGRTGLDVAATAGVGGALAAPIKAFGGPALAPLANAIGSSGMTTGARVAPGIAAKVADMGTRMAGGGITGGASMAAIDPEHAGTGLAIGMALPPVLKGLGVTGQTLANGWRAVSQPRTISAAEDLAKALGVATPEQRRVLVEQLRSAPELITNPTVAQALQTPEAGILQRVVHDSPGGRVLRDKIAAQATARTNALEGVAATAPNGLAMAREDLGQMVTRRVTPQREAAKARVNALYEAVDPSGEVRLNLPVDEFAAARDKYLGPGTFGQGKGTAQAIDTANAIGTVKTPALITNMRQAASDEIPLGVAVRRLGIHPDELKGSGTTGYAGEVRSLRESTFGRGLVNKNGKSLERVAERMHEDGYLERADVSELLNKLTDEAGGSPTFSRYANPERIARDPNMPGKRITPGTSTPLPVDWRTLQSYRSSVGDAAAQAEAKGANKDAAALKEINNALSRRVDQAGAMGLLQPGEAFPLEAFARWTDANAAHAARIAQYDTGPLAGIFRKGPNGEPALQGGEIAARAWGARPGLADDVKAFKRLVGQNPEIMGQFKSMVTTEGAATADATGNLTTKFSKWVDKTLPGLKETFSPEEVKTLQRVAADIDRAAAATKAGTSLGGSNTYQNAANALSLGVLDSATLNALAGRAPVIGRLGGMALDAVKGHARNAKAERLAELLADANTAANSLSLMPSRNGLALERLNQLMPSIYRGAPRTTRDR
jgi:hypothetical protein